MGGVLIWVVSLRCNGGQGSEFSKVVSDRTRRSNQPFLLVAGLSVFGSFLEVKARERSPVGLSAELVLSSLFLLTKRAGIGAGTLPTAVASKP